MKEAFWGTLIIILGLFGIVVINVFQNITVDNDRVYYVMKESTQAAALDALDLTYYRLNGDFRIVEEKFVENLTRRFAQNITKGDYTIFIHDVNELPPKVSLTVKSGVTALSGEKFGITNRVDGIIEAKYSKEELDELGEGWINSNKVGYTDKTCKIEDDHELSCIPGDLKFDGFEDSSLKKTICQDETAKTNVAREVKYKVCECGNWEDKTETVYANPVTTSTGYEYTWTFTKSSDARTISESIKEKVKKLICTLDIEEMVPKDIHEKTPNEDGSAHEPSGDNSKYMVCPPEGIRIPVGMKFVMHPNYIPKESVNRNLTWSVNDTSILGIQSTNPLWNCKLNSKSTNCFSKATITAKKVGTTYVNVLTDRNQSASCKVEVFDGNVDSVNCSDLTLTIGVEGVMKRKYSPLNATKLGFTWSLSNTRIASINSSTGAVTAKLSGTATVTVTAPNGKKGTCTLTVKPRPTGTTISSGGGSCSVVFYEHTYYKPGGTYDTTCYGPYDKCGCAKPHPNPRYSEVCLVPLQCSYDCKKSYPSKSIWEYVTYSGTKEVRTTVGSCIGGSQRVTTRIYCKVIRTRFYDANPTYYELLSSVTNDYGC